MVEKDDKSLKNSRLYWQMADEFLRYIYRMFTNETGIFSTKIIATDCVSIGA